MKIIDAHNHPDWLGYNLDKFIANMDEYKIDKTWLLSWECPREEYHDGTPSVVAGPLLGVSTGPIPFARCVSYAERAPERFILGYAPDPRDKDACRKLCAAKEIYNVKICGEAKWRIMYNNFDCLRLFRTAGRLKMPVTMHFGYDYQFTYEDTRREWFGGSIDTLEDVLKSCPDTKFLGHAPGFWVHISNDDFWKQKDYPTGKPITKDGRISQLLRKYPNLFCDISANSGLHALSRDPKFAKEFFLEFQDRILYARDSFHNNHQDFIYSLELPDSVLTKVFSANAERLLEE